MFGRLYQLSSSEARRRADELLERFDLGDAAERVAKTYSGGMRRRLDNNAGTLVVLIGSGLVVGWRVRERRRVPACDRAPALLHLRHGLIGVLIGLLVPSVEVGQQLGFLIIFPLTFLSNAFVPTETLPGWLRPVAEWNPFSALTAATRNLFGNPNPFASGSFPGEHPLLLSLLWTIGLLVVFAPLAVAKYRSIDR